jgi:orotidine-5'-phosphate decarboxylase
MEKARQKLIVAIDFPSLGPAFEISQSLAHLVGMFKINIQLFTAAGPAAVEKLRLLGPEIFLDLKFHDIPNTVIGAVASAVSLPGVRLLNIHTLGGIEMMRAAAKERDACKIPASQRPKVLGVTILTSMDSAALKKVGIAGPASRRVVTLARIAKKAGLDGVVASPQEARSIRRACGKDFLIVVPGVRPKLSSGAQGKGNRKLDDQARIATPYEAIRNGADYIVVGRPITAAPDPVAAARAIVEEIGSALS